ncbi:hypothetical protein Glove_851g7 [Diversispora epigaea]|uniref:Protein kinase domain-containing protein n=1 Tax=Diversispora epigaea TaxID=1348612 RepID=A0A397G3E4_9GLOM|nr:hypothetical protein Glove_851g7 [Diversispora epigaea]
MTEIFFTRKIEGSNKNIKCIKCKSRSRINSLHICHCCYDINSLSANSGNINIDNFIKGTRLSSKKQMGEPFFKWVPYEKFRDVEKIGKGGFSQIFKATWKNFKSKGTVNWSSKREIVLKVLNNSQNVDTEFLNELKQIFQFNCYEEKIKCYGVTQDPQTKNYAFVLEYARNGDLHHFIHTNFEEFKWKKKTNYLINIIEGIKKIHDEKIIHRNLHSCNILVDDDRQIISDLGFSQPANIDSNLSRKSQIYGIIPYMAPELFKNQPYSYASDIYSLGMIMWELTSGHRPFHDQEHGPKLILDILDGKRPEITEDTPELYANLTKKCWHPDPSQRLTIRKIYEFSREFNSFAGSEKFTYDNWLKFKEAEKKRLEMVKSKKPFVKNPGYKHPNSRYYSILLNPMLESISSTAISVDFNFNQKNNFENSEHNSSAKNSKKHFLDELLQEENIEDQNDFKRRKIIEYFNECF